MVRRIDVGARGVYWSEGGSLVAIASDNSFYMLEYNRDVAESFLASGEVGPAARWGCCCVRRSWCSAALSLLLPAGNRFYGGGGAGAGGCVGAAGGRARWLLSSAMAGWTLSVGSLRGLCKHRSSALPGTACHSCCVLQEVDEDGIEDAFELTSEIPEKIRTGIWVTGCPRPARTCLRLPVQGWPPRAACLRCRLPGSALLPARLPSLPAPPRLPRRPLVTPTPCACVAMPGGRLLHL